MSKILIAFLIVLVAIVLLLFIVCGFIWNQLVCKNQIPLPSFVSKIIAGNEMPDSYDEFALKAEKRLLSYPTLKEVTLLSSTGKERLIARVLTPEKSNGRLILACHGARSWGIGEFALISEYFYNNGYTLIMPDHRGSGDSEGKYMGYGTHESVDAFLWVDYAKKNFENYDIFLLGVSMGAATVLMMSEHADDNAIKGIIADCSYTSAWNEFSYQIKTSFHLPEFPILHICNLYNKLFAGYSYKNASPINAVKNAKKPILFIHGEADDFVPYYMEKELYDACCAEKEIVSVSGAVHARSYFTNPELYQNVIADFMNKYSKTQLLS